MYSLLSEAIISIQTKLETRKVSLPQLLVELVNNTVVDFSAVQMHQEHALYTLCAQLGAMAMYKGDLDAMPSTAKDWHSLLLKLSNGSEAAWELVGEDLSKPAFMQSPVPEGTFEGVFGNVASTPDELDRLVCAKNHDLKMARIKNAQLEHWFYALIGRQTMEGFSGAYNYGIARMNSGYGNRSMTALVKDLAWGTRFRTDVELMLRNRDKVVDAIGYAEDGICLAWLTPWDGKTTLSLSQLDPWFIEIARRIRLAKDKYNLVAHMGTSKSALVDTGDNKGIMGDIWTPVITEEQPKAWTVDPMGFPYSRVAWLLFGGSVKLPPSVNLQRGGGMLVLQAIPRGQGKTEGFHELLLALPNRMSTVEGLAEIRALTEDRIKVIDAVRKSILYPALVNFFTCGVSNLNEKRHLTWLDEFKKNVNSMFFPALWDDLKLDVDQRGAAFQQRLLTLSKSILNRAFASGAVASSVKRKSIAIAENIYEAGVFKMFESSQNKEK